MLTASFNKAKLAEEIEHEPSEDIGKSSPVCLFILGCISIYAHKERIKQYASGSTVILSTRPAICALWRIGCPSYTLAKKNSAHLLMRLSDRRSDDPHTDGGVCARYCTIDAGFDRCCVSLISVMTLALFPFGPFFWGTAS